MVAHDEVVDLAFVVPTLADGGERVLPEEVRQYLCAVLVHVLINQVGCELGGCLNPLPIIPVTPVKHVYDIHFGFLTGRVAA
ncbi:hypothetical protein GCM10022205_11960 [Spinactinospora alkalitolerans]